MQQDHASTPQHKTVALIKQNDRATLKRLYDQNYFKIESYILKNSGSRQQAKDIFQEAFIAMWKNIKQDRFNAQSESAVAGYLYQIAKNKWIDKLRSSRYKKTVTLAREIKIDDEPQETDDDLYTAQIATITQALQQMGERCRKILQLFYFEQKSMREIAIDLKLEESSARNSKYRCMEKLRMLAQNQNP